MSESEANSPGAGAKDLLSEAANGPCTFPSASSDAPLQKTVNCLDAKKAPQENLVQLLTLAERGRCRAVDGAAGESQTEVEVI